MRKQFSECEKNGKFYTRWSRRGNYSVTHYVYVSATYLKMKRKRNNFSKIRKHSWKIDGNNNIILRIPGSILCQFSSKPSCAVLLSDLNHKYSIFCVDRIFPLRGSSLPQNLENMRKKYPKLRTNVNSELLNGNFSQISFYLPIIYDADDRPSWICSQSYRHSKESSTLNRRNVTFNTLFSSVLINHAHTALWG